MIHRRSEILASVSAVLAFMVLPDLKQVAAVFAFAVTVGAAVVGAIYGTVRGVQKYRAGLIIARRTEEHSIQERVDRAVYELRSQYDARILLLKETNENYDRLLSQKDVERKFIEDETTRLREQRINDLTALAAKDALYASLQAKYEHVVDLNLGLQGSLRDQAGRLDHLERERES